MNSSLPHADSPDTAQRTVGDRLARLTAGRIVVGERVVAAARAAGAAAVLVVGSLGNRRGDAFSDLDLLIITGPNYTGLDPSHLFGPQLLTTVTDQGAAAPAGVTYTGICLNVAGVALWLDLVQWPMATAALPSDSVIAYTRVDMPYSNRRYRDLLNDHAEPVTSAIPMPASDAASELRHIADAAKHLARSDHRRITAHIPQATRLPLDQIRPLVRQRLATIDQPAIAAAIAATTALVDLADLHRAVAGRPSPPASQLHNI